MNKLVKRNCNEIVGRRIDGVYFFGNEFAMKFDDNSYLYLVAYNDGESTELEELELTEEINLQRRLGYITQKEVEQRLAEYKQKQETAQEQQEKSEYERLRQKYGDKV